MISSDDLDKLEILALEQKTVSLPAEAVVALCGELRRLRAREAKGREIRRAARRDLGAAQRGEFQVRTALEALGQATYEAKKAMTALEALGKDAAERVTIAEEELEE